MATTPTFANSKSSNDFTKEFDDLYNNLRKIAEDLDHEILKVFERLFKALQHASQHAHHENKKTFFFPGSKSQIQADLSEGINGHGGRQTLSKEGAEKIDKLEKEKEDAQRMVMKLSAECEELKQKLQRNELDSLKTQSISSTQVPTLLTSSHEDLKQQFLKENENMHVILQMRKDAENSKNLSAEGNYQAPALSSVEPNSTNNPSSSDNEIGVPDEQSTMLKQLTALTEKLAELSSQWQIKDNKREEYEKIRADEQRAKINQLQSQLHEFDDLFRKVFPLRKYDQEPNNGNRAELLLRRFSKLTAENEDLKRRIEEVDNAQANARRAHVENSVAMENHFTKTTEQLQGHVDSLKQVIQSQATYITFLNKDIEEFQVNAISDDHNVHQLQDRLSDAEEVIRFYKDQYDLSVQRIDELQAQLQARNDAQPEPSSKDSGISID